MIKKNDTVISVHVLHSGGDSHPCIQWTYAEDITRQVKEIHTDSEVPITFVSTACKTIVELYLFL